MKIKCLQVWHPFYYSGLSIFNMQSIISSRIRFLYLFSMVSLVFVHGYTLQTQLKSPSDLIYEPLDFTSFFEMLTVNSLLRFRIPLLMMMSGYLMAKSSCDSQVCLIKSRIKTLVVPFILISLLSLFLIFVLETVFYTNTRTAIWVTRVDQLSIKGILYRIFVNPFAYQLWYIKFIFLLTIFYPVLKFLNSRIPMMFLTSLFLLWVFTEHSHFLKHTRFIFFFAMGMLLFEKKINITIAPKWFSRTIFFGLFLFLGVLKTYLSFKGFELMGAQAVLVTRMLFDANILVGILLFWFGIDPVVYKIDNAKWYIKATKYGFFIYAFHAPAVNLLNKPLLALTQSFEGNRLLVFMVLPILVIIACAIFHEIVKGLSPGFFQLLTGARAKGEEAPTLLASEPDLSSTYLRINKDLASRYNLYSQQLTY